VTESLANAYVKRKSCAGKHIENFQPPCPHYTETLYNAQDQRYLTAV